MRGFLSLEPDEQTLRRLVEAQNRLRDGLTRQGVSFPERLDAPLLSWPFATRDQLSEAAERLPKVMPILRLGPMEGRPSSDRPGEVGFGLLGAEELQRTLFAELREPVDPDPPKPAFVRLARVAPASRKVGAALRSMGPLDEGGEFLAQILRIWNQTPQGFEVYATMRAEDGRP